MYLYVLGTRSFAGKKYISLLFAFFYLWIILLVPLGHSLKFNGTLVRRKSDPTIQYHSCLITDCYLQFGQWNGVLVEGNGTEQYPLCSLHNLKV